MTPSLILVFWDLTTTGLWPLEMMKTLISCILDNPRLLREPWTWLLGWPACWRGLRLAGRAPRPCSAAEEVRAVSSSALVTSSQDSWVWRRAYTDGFIGWTGLWTWNGGSPFQYFLKHAFLENTALNTCPLNIFFPFNKVPEFCSVENLSSPSPSSHKQGVQVQEEWQDSSKSHHPHVWRLHMCRPSLRTVISSLPGALTGNRAQRVRAPAASVRTSCCRGAAMTTLGALLPLNGNVVNVLWTRWATASLFTVDSCGQPINTMNRCHVLCFSPQNYCSGEGTPSCTWVLDRGSCITKRFLRLCGAHRLACCSLSPCRLCEGHVAAALKRS